LASTGLDAAHPGLDQQRTGEVEVRHQWHAMYARSSVGQQ